MLRPWLPLDIYLAWRIKAAHAVTQSRPPPQPSIPPHLFHAKRRWWANEFLWPPINHANEPHPAKIISYSQHMSQWAEEVGVWLMKQAQHLCLHSPRTNPFFSHTFPLFQSFPFLLHFICSSLALRAPYPPLCSFPHSSQSSFPIRFSHPSPVAGPLTSLSFLLCSFHTPPPTFSSLFPVVSFRHLLKADINSPVLFPLVLLKNVLWDGINQHQVWHLPEDTERTYTQLGWSKTHWLPLSVSPPQAQALKSVRWMASSRPSVCRFICLLSRQQDDRTHMWSWGSISI